jgi:hypothetical protein
MSAENKPGSQIDQTVSPIPSENWVVLTPEGARVGTPLTKDELATIIARRLRPEILTIHLNPSEKEIKRILHQYTSEHRGFITKGMKDIIAEKLRRPEKE